MLEAAYKDTLFVISDEMRVTLSDIKAALELAIETKDNKHLTMVRDLLHTAKGALDVIDFKATAMLASEMISVVGQLLERKSENREAALEAVSAGVVLLPSFFSKTIESEGKENSIALLPVLQELRSAREAKPLSEDTLILLDVRRDSLADKTVQMPKLSTQEDLRLLIGKYRPVFQTSLLGWIKDADSEKHLTRLAVIVEKFQQAAKEERTFKLWWVTGGLIEALLEKGLKSGPELRRLLGQVDRAGKTILDDGEADFQSKTDGSLINQLLYFIGRSSSNGKHITEIRKAFSLNETLHVDEKLDEARSAMAAPDAEVMQSLSLAIREDLDKVKDTLDIFNRTGSKDNLQIEQRFESLKKIADTLQMLGLNELEKRVLDQQQAISTILERNEPLTDNHLIGVAASLLQVESRLEEELDKLAGKKGKEKPKYLLDALQATYRETKVNLARLKEVIAQFMRDPTDIKPISRAPLLLKEARAATMMAEKERLAVILERLQDYISRHLIGSGRLPYAEHLELLAGAIESVDFYLETLNKGRRDPWYMLDNADTCLEQLLREAPKPLPIKHGSNLPAGDGTVSLPVLGDKTLVGLGAHVGTGTVALPVLTPDAVNQIQKQGSTKDQSSVKVHPDAYPIMDPDVETDPETIEIFIEEANEVQQEITKEFKLWRVDDTQRDSLVSVRRGYHTLKGSGRMVGARRMGEFAWAAENLINRVLEGTIKLDDDGLHLLERSIEVIPALIEQLETGIESKEDAHQLMLSVESYIEQKINTQVDRSEITHLPGDIAPDHNIADTRKYSVLIEEKSEPVPSKKEPETPVIDIESQEVDENRPQTQIIDMREMIKSEATKPAENMHTQIMDMRSIVQSDGANSLDAIRDRLKAASEASQMTPEKPSVSKAYHLEDQLYKIYADESSKHLAVVREFSRESVGKTITSKMHRAVHTLHGSANMANLIPIMNLAAELEYFVQRLYDEGLAFEPHAAQTVLQVATNLEAMIATINTGQNMPSEPQALMHELVNLRAQIDAISGPSSATDAGESEDAFDLDFSVMDKVISEESEAISPSARFSDSAENVGFIQMPDALEPDTTGQADEKTADETIQEEALLSEGDLADIFGDTATDDKTELESDELIDEDVFVDTAMVDVTEQAEGELIDSTERTDELLDELEVELDDILIVADSTPEPKNGISEHAPTMLAVDSEITNIFLEEADEIIANTDAAVATWNDEGLSSEKMVELQRYLHTMKGGARMAGLLSLGDFTHELESFIIALSNGVVEQDEPAKKVLQSAVDHIHTMLDNVQQGEPPQAAPHILDSMQALVDGNFVDIGDAQPASEAAEAETSQDEVKHEVPASEDVPVLSATEEATQSSDALQNLTDSTIYYETYAEEVSPEQPVAVEIAEKTIPEEVPVDHQATDAGSIFEYQAEVIPVQQRQQDATRISTNNLETLLNQAGEVSIFRSRIEQELSSANLNLAELARTVNRVKEQLRKMEIETEATILYQHKDETELSDFDPLEMDQYSNVQQLSRALAESVNDLQSLETLLENQFRETEALLLQQSRVMTDLQDNLMRVRMVPFARYAPRYARIVRQIANETSKDVELNVVGADSEIDRQVIERMQAPLEHMIRNAVIHGIESPDERSAAGKDPEGTIELRLSREGSQLLMEMEDDGAGLNLEGIREKALSLGLLMAEQDVTDADLTQLILNPGFSTAKEVTQSAGRGVGMDVVASEIKQLGGTLQISTEAGKGTRFLMRLPFTRAINHALLVRAGEENYAIPIHKIDGVAKMSLTEVQRLLANDEPVYKYADREYSMKTLAQLVGSHNTALDPDEHELSVIMVTGGDHHAALVVNELIGSREMVIKPVGPQIASIRGVSGATILGDGRIVIILDMDALLGVQLHEIKVEEVAPQQASNPLILVVDDSITVRRVTERLLERNNMDVLTARDGLDAVTVLLEQTPDLILLDIEMPRMDGYEFAEHVRKDERTRDIPIIMITSRTGDKHRNRAMELGVDDYLGKPYREDQLLEAIKPHLSNQSVN